MCHICHISTTFNLRSGSARRTSAILRACIEQGYKVSLITGMDNDVRQEDIPGVEIISVPGLVKKIAPLSDIIMLWKLRVILKQIKVDLVHTHLAKAGICGRLAAASLRVACILHTVHGPTFPKHFHPVKRRIFRFLEQLCGRVTDRFIFVGHELRTEYIEAKVCLAEKADVIQTGRPDAVFERTALIEPHRSVLRSKLCRQEKPTFLIVVVGRLVPSKQLEHSIQILDVLHKEKVRAHLAIVGKCLLEDEKDYEKNLRELAHDLGVHDYVHFTGFQNDIVEIMAAADVVLLTSQYEGLPNVAVEALLSGTPMITYDVSGVREILQQGISGWVVPQGDMKQVVQIVLQLMRLQACEGGTPGSHQKKIPESFRESVMVTRKIELYKKCFQTEAVV